MPFNPTFPRRVVALFAYTRLLFARLLPAAAQETMPLFNGKNLDGWTVYTPDSDPAAANNPYVNGQLVNEVTQLKQWDEATKTWLPPTKGRILLLAKGAEIFYRNITLQPLPPT